MNVLLVDDDEVFNFLSERVLRSTNCVDNIHVCVDGKSAIEFLTDQNNQNIDIILLDINMPVLDGFGFLDTYMSISNNKANVYMLTSSIDYRDKEKALSYPCVKGFYSKPLTVNMALEIVNNY